MVVPKTPTDVLDTRRAVSADACCTAMIAVPRDRWPHPKMACRVISHVVYYRLLPWAPRERCRGSQYLYMDTTVTRLNRPRFPRHGSYIPLFLSIAFVGHGAVQI